MSDSGELGEPVLVVDDEETVRSLMSMVARRAGGSPELAESVARARQLLADREYAVCLIDKNLPDGNGVELLGEIKRAHPDTECLIITGYASMESALEAIRLGAFDYLVKPFDVAGVVHRIRIALERRRLRRERDELLAQLRSASASMEASRQEVKRAYLETVLSLSRVAEFGDEGASRHVQRISRYAGILARALDASPDWVESLVVASPLHDVGMVAVPDEIVRKKGPLLASEREEMMRHVDAGLRILEGTHSDILALAREIILTHHEKWDGSGYPKGLKGDEIPLSGRIVALCDAWDAMTTDRVYRRARPPEDAVAEIRRSAGSHFDPALVEAFLEALPRFEAVLSESQ